MTKKVVLLAALLLLPSLGLAGTVAYTTLGTVTGTVPMTFTGTSQVDSLLPTVSSLGTFAFNCSGSCSGTDTFTIFITQSLPGHGTGTLTATLSGILAFDANGIGTLTFGPATIITAAGLDTTYAGINLSFTTNAIPLYAHITQGVHVPEPNAQLLLGLGTFGLLGLAMISLKKIVSC
jgi:hypothetical protein